MQFVLEINETIIILLVHLYIPENGSYYKWSDLLSVLLDHYFVSLFVLNGIDFGSLLAEEYLERSDDAFNTEKIDSIGSHFKGIELLSLFALFISLSVLF